MSWTDASADFMVVNMLKLLIVREKLFLSFYNMS